MLSKTISKIPLLKNHRVMNTMALSFQTTTAQTTVDNSEIHHFSKYVGSWWDEYGEFKPLHAMNMVRVPFIRDGLINTGKVTPELMNTSKPLTGLNLLDVGCGGGILTEPLARLGGRVTGLDASPDIVECAKAHSKEDPEVCGNVDFECSSIDEFVKTKSECYDAVVASEIIEHISDKELFVKSCVDAVKPGGSIFITTINKTNLAWLAAIVLAQNVLNIVSKDTHDWSKFISPREVQWMLEKYGCRTILIHGMFYNVLMNRWHWVPDTSVNYVLHAVKE